MSTLTDAHDWVLAARRIVVLTGAGISTDSEFTHAVRKSRAVKRTLDS